MTHRIRERVDSGEGMPLTAAEVLSALAAHECRAAVLALAVRRLENSNAGGIIAPIFEALEPLNDQ